MDIELGFFLPLAVQCHNYHVVDVLHELVIGAQTRRDLT